MKNDMISFLGEGDLKKILQFRVKENTELLDAIIKVAIDNKIHSAVILSGVGALSKAVCRNLKWFPKEYPVKDEDRLFYQAGQPLELLSLSGWIASKKDSEEVEVHAHFSASTIEEGKVVSIGGHLTKGTITGIKVVVALVILDKDNFYADFDMNTKSIDLFC